MPIMNARKRSLLDRLVPLTVLLPLLVGACAGMPGEDKSPLSNDPSVNLMRLAHTSEAKGDPRSAAALYQQAHIVSPGSIAPLLALGANLRAQGDYAGASEAYRRVIAIEPHNIEAMRGLGIAQVGMEEPRAALDTFNRALHVDSRDAKAWNGRGVALDMLERHPEAQHAYRTGLWIAQDDEALRSNLVLSQSMSPAPLAAASAPAPAQAAARSSIAQDTSAASVKGWKFVDRR